MKEKIYDKILKDEINPQKLYTFANVKLLDNFGINCMTNHHHIMLFTKKIHIRRAKYAIYTNFGLTPVHFNEVPNLKQQADFLIGIIYYSS